jgi:hypothetical protein
MFQLLFREIKLVVYYPRAVISIRGTMVLSSSVCNKQRVVKLTSAHSVKMNGANQLPNIHNAAPQGGFRIIAEALLRKRNV